MFKVVSIKSEPKTDINHDHNLQNIEDIIVWKHIGSRVTFIPLRSCFYLSPFFTIFYPFIVAFSVAEHPGNKLIPVITCYIVAYSGVFFYPFEVLVRVVTIETIIYQNKNFKINLWFGLKLLVETFHSSSRAWTALGFFFFTWRIDSLRSCLSHH